MKRLTVLLVMLLAFSIGAYATEQKETVKKYTQEEWDKHVKDEMQEIWNANLRLEYPGDWMKGILYITTEKDPMENFKEDLKKNKKEYLETSNLKRFKEQNIQMSWNSIFNTVRGESVTLLENNLNKNSRHGVGSNNFKKQWLVTKATGNNDKNICWSIPLKFKKGKTIDVTLTEKNTVSNQKLEKIYDSIIK